MIVLFDGVCNLCNGLVSFIIHRDTKNIFKFAALQSERGKEIIKKSGLEPGKLYTVFLIDDEKIYGNSTAVLRILKNLKGLWRLMYIFILVPPFIRNTVYNIIANKRYRWFGKRDKCMVPDERIVRKFLN